MSVKRVSESYTHGSAAGARRPPHSPGARSSTQGQTVAYGPPPKAPSKAAATSVDEAVMAAIAAEIAALHQPKPAAEAPVESPTPAPTPIETEAEPDVAKLHADAISDLLSLTASEPVTDAAASKSAEADESETAATAADNDDAGAQSQGSSQEEAPPAVDYREIITNTIAGLKLNTAETRRGVYDHARKIVEQQASPDLVERERESLDKIIADIEAGEREKQPAPTRLRPLNTPTKPAKPVLPAKRRDVPQVKQTQGGVLRLFAIVGLIGVGLIGWIVAGRPGMKSAVDYLPPLRGSTTAETSAVPPADEAAAEQPQTADNTDTPPSQSAVAEASSPNAVAERPSTQESATPESNISDPSRTPGGNPLMSFPREGNGQPPTSADSAAWIASYGTMKSPPRPNQPGNSAEAARLLDAGRAAAAPSATSSFQRGIDKAKNDDSDGAIRDFTEAIRIDPNFVEAFIQRGNARFKNGNADLAVTDFSDAIGIDGRNASAFKARGMARLYNTDEDGAMEDLTKAIQIAESEPARMPPAELFFARRTRAGIYSRRQVGDRELFDLSAMIDAYWKNPDLADALKTNYGTQGATALMATIYRQRAALYVARANTDGAVADLSFALQLDPTRAIQLTLERARIQEAAGKREQAAADFQRVLQINPRVDEARQAVVRLKQ